MSDQNSSEKKVIKKVTPYPIMTSITQDGTSSPTQGQILKLTPIGFLARFQSDFFKVGDNYHCQFELPVYHTQISEDVKVIKTYDGLAVKASEAQLGRVYTVEFHFRDASHPHRLTIQKFMAAIGQTP